MNFTWIPFYKEFAQKLLKYRNNRASWFHRIGTCSGYMAICKDILPI